ncbi:hypothetical protein DS745_01590 [Anaerobacillus alkaliphilus]|uniref:Uncharacterized protein n=1 Tax=Anaerobacillus alkaliphilus TaxID=1548597 RepID=A0A4Q0VWT2_9BACI|nr:hypothetical protein [Anaerobacillus alkaliphilus]RXJ04104.1 hypothetical protein DS745_01590 [Anaerobacillus alkaliphilus]
MDWIVRQLIKQAFYMVMDYNRQRRNRSFYVVLGLGFGLALAMMRERSMDTMTDPVTESVGEMGLTNPLG